jgi:hypothetical protein
MPNSKHSTSNGKFIEHAQKVERICENCGTVFTIKVSSLKYGRGKCCSRQCVDEHKRLTYKGPQNPVYGKRKKRTPFEKERLRMLNSARRRAREKGLDLNIDITDILIPEKCPLLDIPLQFNSVKCRDNSPTIDRIDCKLGYVKGNVQIISFKANTIKNNATVEELNLLTERLQKIYDEKNQN